VLDSAGDVFADWSGAAGTRSVVEVAERPAGRAFTRPVIVGETIPGLGPAGATDPRGGALAFWTRFAGGPGVGEEVELIEGAHAPAGGGAWSSPFAVSTPGPREYLSAIAFDAGGDAIAAWQQTVDGWSIVRSATRSAVTGLWSPAVDLSAPGLNSYVPKLVVDARGDVTALWSSTKAKFAESGITTVRAAELRAGAKGWRPSIQLSASGHSAGPPFAAVDARGRVYVAWDRYDGISDVAQVDVRSASRRWGRPMNVSCHGRRAFMSGIAVDPAGDSVVVWDGSVRGRNTIEAAARPAGRARWTAPTLLSPGSEEAYEPRIGLDSRGNALVAWEQSGAGSSTVELADYTNGHPPGRALPSSVCLRG
jgi:hypothetical protein